MDVAAGTGASAAPSAGCRPRGSAPAARSTAFAPSAAATMPSTVGLLLAAPEPAAPAEAPEHLDRRVAPHAEHREQRLADAVAAEQHDPGRERAVRRRAGRPSRRCTGPIRPPGSTPARQRRSSFCPLPSAPAMPEDLAPVQREVERAEPVAVEPVDARAAPRFAATFSLERGTRAGAAARSSARRGAPPTSRRRRASPGSARRGAPSPGRRSRAPPAAGG